MSTSILDLVRRRPEPPAERRVLDALVVVREALHEWLPVIVGLVPAAVLLGMNLTGVTAGRVPAGDVAVLEIGARSALDGDQLVGAYSRFGWHHPGPALFYWSAPFYRLAGEQLGGLVVAATLVSVLSAGLILRTVQCLAGRTAAWASAVALTAMLWLVGIDHLQSPWNAEVVILPMAALGVVGAAAVAGRRWALPVAAVAAAWVAQAHLGAAPLAVALGAGILVLTVARHRRSLGHWVVPISLAVAATVVLWAPVAWEEVTRSPGNITEIQRFSGDRTSEPHAWSDAVGAVASAVTGHQNDYARDVPTPTPHLIGAGVLVAVVAAGVVLAWVGRRRNASAAAFTGMVCAFGMVGVVVAVVSVHSVDGPILRHLLGFASGLGILLWVGAAMTVATALAPLAGRRWLRWTALAPACLLAAGMTAQVVAVGPWNRTPAHPSTAEGFRHRLAVDNDQSASAAAVALRSALLSPGAEVEVTWPAGWEIGAGVVNELQKAGIDASVPDEVGFIFGEASVSDGDESARVVLVPERREPPPEWGPPPDERHRVGDGVGYHVYVVSLPG